jgi:DNA-binding SARP family transcriptional activator
MSRVRFQVLGEISAADEGRPIALGRPQERCLLAILLIEAGHAVSADRLAELLWDGQPPDSSRSTIQTYVGRLRAVLGAHGVQIITSGGGYRIDVPPASVDLHEFRERLTCARAVAEPGARAGALAAALELWREPLLGEPDRLRMRIGSAFEEMRLAAIAECAEAEIECGRPDLAIERLVEIAAAHPVRENLVGLLMSAYAAAGRKAEALALYRQARKRLVDDLGLEPSEALQARHAAILRSERARPRPALPGEPARPRELPPPVATFTGRRLELAQLTDLARAGTTAGPAVVVIHGRGGVGKSTLAVQAGHQIAADFPDGQIYLDLGGSTLGQRSRTAIEALRQALRSLGLSDSELPGHEAEAAARLRTLTSDRRLLFVLDNASEPAVVRSLIPASFGCAVIITSRIPLGTLDATRRLPIDGLADADAFHLLMRVAGRRGRRGREHDRVIELCERLPLALRIAASRLADADGLSVEELADQLDGQRRLDVLDAGGLAVRSSIGVSYDALCAADGADDRFAASLFPRLVLVPVADLTPRFAAALAGQTELEPAKAALDRLVDLHLLQARAAGRYRLHDLVRLFALEQSDQAPDRDAAIDRVLDLYIGAARRVHEVLLPNRPLRGAPVERQDIPPVGVDSMAEANAWLDGELPNVLAAAQFVGQTGHSPLFPLRLSNSLHLVLGKRAAWSAERQLAEFAVAATAPTGELVDHCDAVRALGQAHLHQGNLTEAAGQLAQAVELARAAGERRRQFAALLDLGRAALLSGDHALAVSQMTECLDVARSEGWTMPEAIVLLNLSSVYVAERRWGEAREALEASLRVRREWDDVAGLSVVLPALARVEFELGHVSRALELFEEGQQACQTAGNDVDGWYVVFARSVVWLTTGSARLALRDAAAAMRACGPGRDYEISCTLRLLAAAFAAAGKTGLAADYRQRARAAAYAGHKEASVEMLLARCQAEG